MSAAQRSEVDRAAYEAAKACPVTQAWVAEQLERMPPLDGEQQAELRRLLAPLPGDQSRSA